MIIAIILFVLAGIVSLVLLIGIIGLLLPRERKVSCQTTFEASPETVYKVVTNNEDYSYRRDIKEINILKKDGEEEEWEEVGYNGTVIHFKTKDKVPFTFYSFDMKGELFTGFWTATFEETENGGTRFTAKENIRIRNPYLKILSYPFFRLGHFMENYQTDLRARLKELPRKN